MLSLFLVSLLSLFSFAETPDAPCGIELGFGLQNMSITNPDMTTAISQGYGGLLTSRYAFVATEKFHLAGRLSFGYAELDNKANTAVLSETTKHMDAGPGLELRVYNFVLGGDYLYNHTKIDVEGNLQGTSSATFYTPQIFLGIDIPLGEWGLRFYYMRSSGDLPLLDTGLAADSPWSKEQFMIAIRFSPVHNSSRNPYLKINTDSYEPSSSSGDSTRASRPIRYAPRPSTRLGH
jgi:hypothetical protein